MNQNKQKSKHELSVLKKFKKYYKSKGMSVRILDRPDPPDGIVKIDGRKTWIEITDCYLNQQYAKKITASASEIKKEKKKKDKQTTSPLHNIESELKKVILKKYTKNSIGKVYEELGRGILLVGIFSPLHSAQKLVKSEKKLIKKIKKQQQRFEKIYFYSREHHFFEFYTFS